MALDPSISLQAQPVQIQNPLTAYAQVSAIQNAQQQNQLTGLAIQDKQREVGQNQAVNAAFKNAVKPDGTVDNQALLTGVAGAGYGSALPALQKTLTEAQAAQLTQQSAALKYHLDRVGAVAQVLGGVNDQTSYDQAKQWAVQNVGPDAVANLPQQYDPQLIAQKRTEALTAEQQLADQHKNVSDALQASQFAETQRHNQTDEGNTVRGQNMTAATEMRGQNYRAQDYDPKAGLIVNKVTGQATPVIGQNGQPVAAPSQNLTDSQGAATAFGARAQDSQRILQQLESGGVTNGGRIQQAVSGVPVIGTALGSAVNALGVNTDQQQSYQQAKQNFISANLRKESGAAISPEEFRTEEVKYFPQPGDGAEVIAQKARSRDLAIQGLLAEAGPGASLVPGIIARTDQAAGGQRQQGSVQPQQQPAQQQRPAPAAAALPPDAVRAELLRRAQSDPALAARLAAMGH